jgi:hypothetical protein
MDLDIVVQSALSSPLIPVSTDPTNIFFLAIISKIMWYDNYLHIIYVVSGILSNLEKI